MAILQSIPAVLRVLVAFILIVALIRRKVSLGNTFMLGALCLSLLFALGPGAVAQSVLGSVTDPKTLSLTVIVSLILVLSNSMEMAGQLERMLGSFQGLIRKPRFNLVLFPAMIGLLPMPGGAIFSAPMVKQLGAGSAYPPDRLSFINYWFRHIWEYWWPLYPGVLLTSVLADLNLAAFIVIMCPLTLLAVGAGYSRLGKKTGNADVGTAERPRLWPFLRELLPILIVILPGLGLGIILSRMFPGVSVNKEMGLIIALFAAVGWVWRANDLPRDRIIDMLRSPKLLGLIYMILAILVFKGILEDSEAVGAVSRELIALKIPLPVIVAFVPLLVGLVTGITIAFVGSSFPILIPLIRTMDPEGNLLPYMMLALTCGFAGVMLSPVHLCFILTNEYFEIPMERVYRHLWVPCGALVVGSGLYYWILRAFFPS